MLSTTNRYENVINSGGRIAVPMIPGANIPNIQINTIITTDVGPSDAVLSHTIPTGIIIIIP